MDQDGYQVVKRNRVLGHFMPEIFSPWVSSTKQVHPVGNHVQILRHPFAPHVRELLEGSRGRMRQDVEVHGRPFPEVAKDVNPEGSPHDQQRGERQEEQRRRNQ